VLDASTRAGRLIRQQSGPGAYQAFVPAPLPPDPPVQFSPKLQAALERAVLALGRLDGITVLLPDPGLFIYTYVRKEAVLSSQIEGTQSSLSDLLLFENEAAPGVPASDAQEVDNYRAAMEHGLRRLHEGFPLSLRLIREIHEILVRGTRGSNKTPGEFRTSQNWIGGSRPGDAAFVPPPPHEMMSALDNLEKFLHGAGGEMPLLMRAGLVHAQFETIHPFLDGNGRLGRLLITFMLCAEGALSQPLLYLSLHFKTHRSRYYEALQRVRTHGEWEEWLLFFLDGVADVAGQATETARRIIHLFEADRRQLERRRARANILLRVHEHMKRRPVTSIKAASAGADVTFPTGGEALRTLQSLGIVKEVTGRARNRVYTYRRYIDLLNEGTEPLPR